MTSVLEAYCLEPCQPLICLEAFPFLPNLPKMLLQALDEKGGHMRVNIRERQKGKGESFQVNTKWAYTQRKTRLPMTIKKIISHHVSPLKEPA